MSTLSIPAGVIFPYAGFFVPEGWLECNGDTVSRHEYRRLYEAIGTQHGNGDGSKTFHLPDYRGRVLRGHDAGAGVDPDAASRSAMNSGGNTGNQVGSVQDDNFKSHTHTQNAHNHTQASHTHSVTIYDEASGSADVNHISKQGSANASLTLGTQTTGSATPTINNATATNQSTGGNETRMKNAYVKYIIKT